MGWETIRKTAAERATATMPDPDATRAAFAWDDARAMLDGLPGGRLNIAHEAVDRHVAAGHCAQIAIRWLGRDGAWSDGVDGLGSRRDRVMRSRTDSIGAGS